MSKKKPARSAKKDPLSEKYPGLRRLTLPGITAAQRRTMEDEIGIPYRYRCFSLLTTQSGDQAVAMTVDGDLLLSFTNPLDGFLQRLDALAALYADQQDAPDEVFMPSTASLLMYVETMIEAEMILNEDFEDEFEDEDFDEDELEFDLDLEGDSDDQPPFDVDFPGNIVSFPRRPSPGKTDD